MRQRVGGSVTFNSEGQIVTTCTLSELKVQKGRAVAKKAGYRRGERKVPR